MCLRLSAASARPSIAVAEEHPALRSGRLGPADTGNLRSIPGKGTDHGDNADTAADGGARGPVAGPEYHTNVVAQTAKPQHNLEHLGWKPACCADTFGVTAGEAAP